MPIVIKIFRLRITIEVDKSLSADWLKDNCDNELLILRRRKQLDKIISKNTTEGRNSKIQRIRAIRTYFNRDLGLVECKGIIETIYSDNGCGELV